MNKEVNYIGRKSKNTDRAKEVELSKKDKTISRNHASIVKRDGQYYITNEKEDNITILNGVQVTDPRPLLDGDRIKIGSDTVLLCQLSSHRH